MTVKLNKSGYDHAQELVRQGRFVSDDRDAWSEHEPSPRKRMNLSADMG